MNRPDVYGIASFIAQAVPGHSPCFSSLLFALYGLQVSPSFPAPEAQVVGRQHYYLLSLGDRHALPCFLQLLVLCCDSSFVATHYQNADFVHLPSCAGINCGPDFWQLKNRLGYIVFRSSAR